MDFTVHYLLSTSLILTSTIIEAAIIFNNGVTTTTSLNRASFPDGFVFGTSSSAYQYEGAADIGGRTPSIWDTFTHNYPEKIADRSNGDIAIDEYHRYKEDVEIMKDLNMDAYRFSISWSRILPKGKLSGGVNKEGIKYYNNLINELLAKGLKPFVTIFHWDVPQTLEEEYGGFLSLKIVDDFRDYAKLCFEEFGDRVQHWSTLNEPWAFSKHGYAIGSFAPGRCSSWQNLNCTCGDSATEPYNVAHHMLLAHAAAVNIYRTRYQRFQGGKIGITLNCHWMVPLSNTISDRSAAQRSLDFMLGWFMEPITKGDYPSSMQLLVGNRLPKFSLYQSGILRGSFDFIGLNYYTSFYAAHAPELSKAKPSYLTDSLVTLTNECDGIPIGPKVIYGFAAAYQFLKFSYLSLYICRVLQTGYQSVTMAIAFFSVHHFLSVILLLTSTAIQAAAIFNADITTQSEYLNRSAFPQGFIFGTASSSYQVEGAANEGGREPSIWDTFTHKYPGKIYDGSNGDVAVDEYHHYKEDVEAMKDMNMDAYRFSISWSRILPKGRLSGGVNKEGINYYNNLINELLAKDIQPFVTIFHWDLPQALEDEYGGFLSPKIVNDFQDYAEVCFKEFGDRVKHWITLNEPWSYSNHGYAKGSYAPGRCSAWQNRSCTGGDSGTEPYIVTHHQLLAHAVAVNIYKTKYQASQKGLIGIALNCYWMVPLHDTELDKLAAQRALDFMLGWFMEPMTKGDYPSSMRSLVGSRLPKFSSYQSWLLRGSFDFIGLNYYTSYYAADAPELSKAKPSFLTDSLVALTNEYDGIPIGPKGASDWLSVYPEGIRNLLFYFKSNYNNPLIYITENGVA
ncbi:hypothetical protein AHAS_Ahas15G0373600 [Arachis hypogaea]